MLPQESTSARARNRLCLALALLAGGCANLPHRVVDELRVATTPELAAWVAAATLRAEFPATDPLPLDAGAPVQQTAKGRYVVRVARRDGGPLRVAVNARLVPIVDDQGRLARVACVPQSPATGLHAAGDEGILVEIAPAGDGATVTTAVSGDALPVEQVLEHLRRALRVAEGRAAPAAVGVLGCCSAHRPLTYAGLLRQACAARLAGQLQLARDLALHALRVADDPRHAQRLRAELERELQAGDGQATALLWLAMQPGGDATVLRARTTLRELGELQNTGDRATALAIRARGFDADGSVLAARICDRQALAHSADDRAALQQSADALRARGEQRLAFELLLVEAEAFGLDESVLARLGTELAGSGSPAAAARLVLAHGRRLGPAAATRLAAQADPLLARLPPEDAARVLRSATSGPPASVDLERWLALGSDQRSFAVWVRGFARPEPLGSQPRSPRPVPATLEHAPGVTPAR